MGNDFPDWLQRYDNSLNVVTARDLPAPSVIDGFDIPGEWPEIRARLEQEAADLGSAVQRKDAHAVGDREPEEAVMPIDVRQRHADAGGSRGLHSTTPGRPMCW